MSKEGKPYVLDAMKACLGILEGWKEAAEQVESGKAQLQEAKEKLEAIKDKVFLKTKKGLNDAYLLAEAATALEEAFEELKASGNPHSPFQEEFSSQLTEFVTSVDGLHAASKSRSIVIT